MLIKAKSLVGLLLVLLCVHQVSAQNITKSPYSAIGIGDVQFGGSAAFQSMGQVNQALNSYCVINNQNPASYSKFQLSIWDFAATGAIGNLSTQTSSTGTVTASLAYFALGMPLSQKLNWGLSFGLMPYSSVGYNITRAVTNPTYTATEKIAGNGGSSKFYVGTGIKLYKGLSAGINASYIYGQINNTLLLDIPSSYQMYNLSEVRSRYIGDFSTDIGLQYTDTFTYKDNRYTWGLGATFTPQANLQSTEDFSVRTLGVGITDPSNVGKDTIDSGVGKKGVVVLPAQLQAGVYFAEKDKWLIAADVTYQNWQNYQAFNFKDSLKNSLGFKIGGSFTPDAGDAKHFLKRVEYKAGFRYDNGHLKFGDNNINTIGFSVGFGLPLGKSKSQLNLAAEYLVRGTTKSNLIKEEYFRFTIGVSICDKWFYRYKYD